MSCVLQAHNQMALLLSKYDSNMNLSTGNVREQLDTIVDDLLVSWRRLQGVLCLDCFLFWLSLFETPLVA